MPITWAAGLQYDGDIWRANQVLANLSTFYPAPASACYEVAGFFWWQVIPTPSHVLDRISPISSHTDVAVNLRVEKDNATAQALYASVGFAADPSHLVMAYGRTPSGEAVGGA